MQKRRIQIAEAIRYRWAGEVALPGAGSQAAYQSKGSTAVPDNSSNWRFPQGGGHTYSRESTALADGVPTSDEALRQRVTGRAEAIMRSAISAEAVIKGEDIRLEYILPGLVRGTLGLVVGTGASSKSMLALYAAISVALGRDLFGLFPDHEFIRGRVVFLSLEDARLPLAQRYQRLLRSLPQSLQKEIIAAEEEGWLFVVPQLEVGLHPFVRDPKTREIRETEDLLVLEEITRGTVLLAVDTLSVLSGPNGIDENSNSDMGPLISSLNRIAGRNGCAIMLLHHVAKGDDTGSGRGASAIGDNARWRLSMRPMSREEAKEVFGHEQADERLSWVRVEWTKQNYAPPRESMWLQREGGLLRSGAPPFPRGDQDSRQDRRSPRPPAQF